MSAPVSRQFRAWAYRLLDRRGGRSLLAVLATRRARRSTDSQVAIFYDGVWIQQFGDDFVVSGKGFRPIPKRAHESHFESCEDYWFYVYQPRPGDVIVDAGAGVGSDTLLFSRAVGSAGRVLAIEAHPDTFKLLEKTVRWNALANVTLCPRAVVDKARTVFIEDRDDLDRNAVSLARLPASQPEAIEGASLDDICSHHDVAGVSFLKMNIEGAEALALGGMYEVIKRTDAVCIACHDFMSDESAELRTRDRVVAFLEAQGFVVVRREDDPRDFVRDHVHGYRPAVPIDTRKPEAPD